MPPEPEDESDHALLAHVHPPEWRNPEPAPLYDLVVVGGGTAGLVCAAGAAGLGARVALVERARLGGDCLHTGCVPSKALLRSARAVWEARSGAASGVSADPRVDFPAVMARLRQRRMDLAPHDSAARFTSLGVDVFFGDASFSDRRTVGVDGLSLRFRRAVIATGARPGTPPIPGLSETPYLSSDNLFALTALPRSLVVLGAGPIGCEMAQAFALLGACVTLVDTSPRVLPRDDEDAGAIVARALERSGVRLLLGVRPERVARGTEGVTVSSAAGSVTADALLVATGRAPNIERLNLAAAGVGSGTSGVAVDDRLRTSNPRIYAAGDVCSPYRFTHAADAMARTVVQNALFFGGKRAGALIIPWCTFTSPEVAHVGGRIGTDPAPSAEATITVRLSEVDRSVVDDESDGFVRIHHVKGRITGATIVAPHAGELIGHIAHLMRTGGTLSDLSATIVPYPTVAGALRRAGDAYRRGALTPRVRAWLSWYFRLMRRAGV